MATTTAIRLATTADYAFVVESNRTRQGTGW